MRSVIWDDCGVLTKIELLTLELPLAGDCLEVGGDSFCNKIHRSVIHQKDSRETWTVASATASKGVGASCWALPHCKFYPQMRCFWLKWLIQHIQITRTRGWMEKRWKGSVLKKSTVFICYNTKHIYFPGWTMCYKGAGVIIPLSWLWNWCALACKPRPGLCVLCMMQSLRKEALTHSHKEGS